MNTNKRILAILILVTSLVMSGCKAEPSYALECDIAAGQLDFQHIRFYITGESGGSWITFNGESTDVRYNPSGNVTGIIVTVNRDMIYEDSQHSYHIEGTITNNIIGNEVTYYITATGDTLGDSPLTCNNP